MRRILFVALALAFLTPTHAQRGGASVDKFSIHLDDAHSTTITRDTKGLALRSQTVSAAIRNLILITVGQSLCENIAPTAYTPTNPTKLDNLNIWDGAIYEAKDPLLGSVMPIVLGVPYLGPGNPNLRIADTLITNNKFDRVIIVSTCIGSTAVADWDTGFESAIFPVIMQRLASLGIVAGTNITIAAIWGQGEQDNILGTLQAAYTTSLNSVITKSRAVGFNGIWFVNSGESYINLTTSAPVQAAQAAVINHGSSIWAGANMDALIGNNCSGVACRAPLDGVHWSDAGSASYAAAVVTAMGLSGAPF